MINTLQERFDIPQSISLLEGKNGLSEVHLVHRSGSSAKIYLHGAHITSWMTLEQDELLFMSEASWFEEGKPIRGGIPVIFPQFGAGSIQTHGFARNFDWDLIHTVLMETSEVEAAFRLQDSPESREIWPYRFEMELKVTLSESSLAVAVQVTNKDEKPFDFQSVLHTYFRVGGIQQTAIKGLRGVRYLDSLRDRVEETEQRDAIRFESETDRIYLAAPDRMEIEDEANDRIFAVEKENMPDAVVWNPWIEKSKRMPDFGDEEYPQMVCLETGVIQPPAKLNAGERYRGRTVFSYR